MTNHEPEFMTWKRRGAERVRRLVEGMSMQEELEFWRKRTEDMRACQRGDTGSSPRNDSDTIMRVPECVAIKRRGAERVRRLVEGMSMQEELEFWRKRTENMRAKKRVSRNPGSQPPPTP